MTSENENPVKITVHAKLIAKQGKVDELLKALEHWAKETREEVGCEYSELLQNIDNPLRFTLVEKYTNYRAFKEHMQMPAIRNFIDNLKLQLVDETEVTFHVTRISCTGSLGQPHVEAFSFREDLMDRKS
ncbi:MAG: putative quinol monooxygenase [Legionellales bacterium]|nr:putative quinol monooxygenase [Legionellales bacterium]